MKCHVCQSELAENSRFCKQCGTPVPATAPEHRCPVCFSVVRPGAAFCNACGTALTAQPNPPAAPRGTQQKRRKKKTPYGLIIALLAALIVLGGSVGSLLHILDDPGGKEAQSQSDRQHDEDEEAKKTEMEDSKKQETSNESEKDEDTEAMTKEDTTEEVTKEELPSEEKKTAEGAYEELLDYMGTDIYYLAVKIGGMSGSSNDQVMLYSNSILEIAAVNGSNEIEYAGIFGESDYCIAGVYYNMNAADAHDLLETQGFRFLQEDGDIRWYFNADDMEVSLQIQDNTVVAVSTTTPVLKELRAYSPDDPSAESPEEETPVETSEYLLPESNSRYLTYEDLEDLSHEELCFARNEIYARHGWIFSVPQLAEYFAGKSWYEGTTLPAYFNSGVLNEFENANIQTISGYESLYYGGSYY